MQKYALYFLALLVQSCVSGSHNASELRSTNTQVVQYRVFNLSESDLQHGRVQLERLLKDRPELASYVTVGDKAHTWVVRHFAGEGTGYKIYWESQEPSNGADGQNHYYDEKVCGAIRVSRLNKSSSPYSPEIQWVTVVYELMNIRNVPYLDKAWKDALAGRVKKDEWVSISTRLEFEAMKRTRDFYREVWLPLMKSKNIGTQEHLWRNNIPDAYESWLATEDSKRYVEYWSFCYPEVGK